MSDDRFGFDAIGVVVDWIDACKHGQLTTLLDLYANDATVECCQGGRFRGRSEMETYWRPRLALPAVGAFEIDALFPEFWRCITRLSRIRRATGPHPFSVR